MFFARVKMVIMKATHKKVFPKKNVSVITVLMLQLDKLVLGMGCLQ